jgi:hypothetical protein
MHDSYMQAAELQNCMQCSIMLHQFCHGVDCTMLLAKIQTLEQILPVKCCAAANHVITGHDLDCTQVTVGMLYSTQHSPAWVAAAARSIVLLTTAPVGFTAASLGCCAAA